MISNAEYHKMIDEAKKIQDANDPRPKPLRMGVSGCMNCRNKKCHRGSEYIPIGDSCQNRNISGDLCDYINSQNED